MSYEPSRTPEELRCYAEGITHAFLTQLQSEKLPFLVCHVCRTPLQTSLPMRACALCEQTLCNTCACDCCIIGY